MSELETSKTLKVFISYSRADIAFADELVDALDFHGGFEVTIDRHSIIEGEDWKKRLGALIVDADTIVFILSPSSAQSDICAWEVEEAHRLSKRILPVRIEATGDCPVPPLLAALNYVRFDPHDDGKPRSFMAGLRALIQALQTDVDWLREHTRLLARALEWDTAGRPENRLLFSADIASAKNWAATRPKDAPEVTELHMEFIRASEQAEEERKNEEHKKLEEIAAAQSAREEALKEAELSQIARARTVRRTYIGIVALVLIAAFAGPPLYQTVVDQRAINAEAARTDLRGQIVTFAGIAYEDDDPHDTMSPYTNDLLKAINNKKSSILSALSNVNRLTLQRFATAELPFISTSMNGDIYLWNQPKDRQLLPSFLVQGIIRTRLAHFVVQLVMPKLLFRCLEKWV